MPNRYTDIFFFIRIPSPLHEHELFIQQSRTNAFFGGRHRAPNRIDQIVHPATYPVKFVL